MRLSVYSVFVMGMLYGCASKRESVRTDSISPSQTSDTISEKYDYSGEWEALNQRKRLMSGHVCYQRNYRLKIDSLGNIYRLGKGDDEKPPRVGWIETDPKRTQRLFFENDRQIFLFKNRNPIYFKLTRNKNHPPDQIYEQEPIADPEIYPDGRTVPPGIECDTEIWQFYRVQ